MKPAARDPATAPRRTVPWLLGGLAVLLLQPAPPTSSATSDSEDRDPRRELILLASGSIAGNLEPCG